MDPVKKEAPISTADQVLIKETGGMPGIDNSEHSEQIRVEIGNSVDANVTPEAELAEKNLRETQVADVIAKVAGLEEKGKLEENNTSELTSGLKEWKQNLDAISPFDVSEESKVREMPSGDADELSRRRQEQMKKAA